MDRPGMTELGFGTVLTEPFVAVLPVAHPQVALRTVADGVPPGRDRLGGVGGTGEHPPCPAEGVAFRRIVPGGARTWVAVAWRRNDRGPLVARLLETIGQDPRPGG